MRTRVRRSRGPGRLVTAAAGFLVVCGVVVLVLESVSVDRPSPEEARQRALQAEVDAALKEVRKADAALDEHNYGSVRTHLRLARERLAASQFQLEDGEPP